MSALEVLVTWPCTCAIERGMQSFTTQESCFSPCVLTHKVFTCMQVVLVLKKDFMKTQNKKLQSTVAC